jgi:NADH-quinone oxidoreductase subunit H
MTWAMVFTFVVKIVIVIAFLMNMAALGAWADRRQSAMVQDRVGPNRAVVYLSPLAVRVILFAPAVLMAGAVSLGFFREAPGLELARMTTGVEVAILVGWFSLVILCSHVRRHGAENAFDEMVGSTDPRNYFYGGLTLHLLALPIVRLLPGTAPGSGNIGPGAAGLLAGVVMMSAGAYAAAKVPDRKVGIRLAGTLHSFADAIKMVWKEDLRPKNADKLLFGLAPLMSLFPALVTIAVIPFGSTVCFKDVDNNGLLDWADLTEVARMVNHSGACAVGEVPVHMQVADLNVGLLYIFAIAGTGIIGAALAGWASDSKFALLGGLRATSQMVSYEVAMGLGIVGLLMVCSSVHMRDIVDWQGANAWGVFVQPLGFVVFMTAVVAETKRVPFDQPEGESEIVAGYFLEYSGMKFGIFMTGEYVEFMFSSALITTLFFGGYHLPFLHPDGLRIAFGETVLLAMPMSHLAVSVIHFIAFFAKTIVITWLHVFVRWTLPRFRYDQLMKLGWTKLLPLALGNIVLTGLILLGLEAAGPEMQEMLVVAADVTQAIVFIGGLGAAVALVTWLLEPSEHRRVVGSTAARFAEARGGVKPGEMQA